jgi:aminoglycoside N3'-acetyltransferase
MERRRLAGISIAIPRPSHKRRSQVIQSIYQQTCNVFSLDEVRRLTQELHAIEENCTWPDFEASARFCAETMRKIGFDDVQVIRHRADGRSTAFDCTMPPAWRRTGRSFAEVRIDDDSPLLLADTEEIPWCLAPWSSGDGALNGPLVYAPLGTVPQVAGCWVLLFSGNGNPPSGEWLQRLAHAGALGVLAATSPELAKYPDSIVWFNGRGAFGWYPVEKDPSIPMFFITPRQAGLLADALKGNRKAAIRAEVHAHNYSGSIYTVTGIIPGREKEEYALLSHLYEPFLADNAFGFGTAMEIARVLLELRLKPRKTLRMVFSMELYGFAAWLARSKQQNIVAALNLDSLNHAINRSIVFRQSPFCQPCFTDWFYPQFFRKHLPDADFQIVAGDLSDDTFPGDPLLGGIAVNWLYNPSGPTHHCSCPDFAPDWIWAQQQLPVLTAAVLELISRKPPIQKIAAAQMREYKTRVREILDDPELSNKQKRLGVESFYDYFRHRIASAERFAGTPRSDASPLQKIRDWAARQIPDKPYEEFEPIEYKAMHTVVRRLRPTPFSLAAIPYEERRSIRVSRLLYSLFDGKRSLLDAVWLEELLIGKRASNESIQEELERLKYLAEYRYVQLHRKPDCTEKMFRDALRSLGITKNMRIEVHSTFSSLGNMIGGPEAVCRILCETVGEKGAILMPVFNHYHWEDTDGVFDPLRSKSRDGIVTEVFRHCPGVYRSWDPSQSVAAWGADAVRYTKNHHLTATFAEDSPLGLLEQDDGYALLISCGKAISFMHVVEHTNQVHCLGVRSEEYPALLPGIGMTRLRTWGWRNGTCRAFDPQKIYAAMRLAGTLEECMLGNAHLLFFRLKDFRKAYEQRLRDPVCGCSGCPVQPRRKSS